MNYAIAALVDVKYILGEFVANTRIIPNDFRKRHAVDKLLFVPRKVAFKPEPVAIAQRLKLMDQNGAKQRAELRAFRG